jgi:hypothetical protein
VAPRGPTLPEAERLEKLRLKHLEGMSLAEFHRQLVQRDGFDVSYAAVRNYHTKRKAPVDYYAQVCRVFGIRLEWLLFGDGEITPSLQMAAEASDESLDWTQSLPQVAPTIWDPSDQVTQAAFLDCVRRLDLARPETPPLTDEQRLKLAKVLDTLVGGALWILRGDDKAPRPFVRSMLLSLAQGIPGPRKGSSFRKIVQRMKLKDDAN